MTRATTSSSTTDTIASGTSARRHAISIANCSGINPRSIVDRRRGSRRWICVPAVTNRAACQHVS